ncbi:pilus assembly protein N-terminal domain-containing protein [Shewanella submarina]|uniref:Type II and III secretion system protein family protein n=1 Tax=Shewanella submarina TaxID=2016376 RepID=A0ABV7GCN4_9GAMM|nr:pilus assembly protein N-terminal domain-containing protein [Shewanella submarina]MCL1037380.1 pilus assembly protein N-terminal domain-containing protein [Shewanella submarina]
MHCIKPIIFGCSLLLVLLFSTSASANRQINLYLGEVKSIHVGEVTRLAVGLDQLLGANILDNGELLLIPKAPGETQLHLWKTGEKKVTFNITILPAEASRVLRQIRSVFRSFDQVTFRHEAGIVLAEGKIRPEDAEMFQQNLQKFPSIMSFVRAEQLELKDMVKMDVKVLEINRSDGMQLGINWDNAISGPSLALVNNFKPTNFVYGSEDNPLLEVFGTSIPVNSSKSYSYAGIATGINSIINLLKEDGTARILAEPSLSTRTGQPASFHSGGAYPLAVLNEFGQPVVQMQEYGIQLDIEPNIDEHGNIISAVRAEMSSIDFSTIVQGVPGLLTRNTESVVNMKSGETLVISGLVKVEDSKSYEKIPYLGDIPVLGELFTSRNFQEGRSELIILVTPSIQQPLTELPEEIQRTLDDMSDIGAETSLNQQLID